MLPHLMRRLSGLLTLCALLAVGGQPALAETSSANYRIQIEAVTSGGGASSSASYLQPDSAVGQSVAMAWSASASYAQWTGVVQPWQNSSQSVLDYLLGRTTAIPRDASGDSEITIEDYIKLVNEGN